MTRVFVNGISAKSAGGLSILSNFLKVAQDNKDSFEYVVVTPSLMDFGIFESEKIRIIPLNWRSRAPLVPLMSTFYLPKMAEQFDCNVIFNLSDIPLKTELPQVFLFDWPYAIYPESIAWGRSSWKDYAIRSLKLLFFKRLIGNVDITIAQSTIVKNRLEKQYGLSNILVIPNTHHLEEPSDRESFDFRLGDGFKCLFLSKYYSHKNFEILLPLAKIIQENGFDIKIIVTLNPADSSGAKEFLNAVKKQQLHRVIKNVGSVTMDQVSPLFYQVDALLMPTLLETMGLTYLEAMHCGKPIFTSDLPFAHAVCEDAAIYFNPFDAMDIMTKIENAASSVELLEEKTRLGKKILSLLPDWQDTYLRYTEAFEQTLEEKLEY